MSEPTRSRRILAWLLVAFCLLACGKKEDDERPHRRPNASTGAGGGGVKPIFGSCPFGLCGGGGDDVPSVCERLRDLAAKPGGSSPIKASELEKCEDEMRKLQTKEPAQYAAVVRCSEKPTIDDFTACLMAAFMADAGVPSTK